MADERKARASVDDRRPPTGRKPKPAPRASREEIDRRIGEIADLMADGRWLGRRSTAKLAEEWGVSAHSIGEYAATASQLVRRSLGTSDELRTRILATLDRISLLALHKGEYVAATRALLGLAEVAGVKAPVKTELSGPDGGPIETKAKVVVLPPLDEDG